MKFHKKCLMVMLLFSTLQVLPSINVAYFGLTGYGDTTEFDSSYGDLSVVLTAGSNFYASILDAKGGTYTFNYTGTPQNLSLISTKLNSKENNYLNITLPSWANNAPGVFAIFDILAPNQAPKQTAYIVLYFDNPAAINDLKQNLTLQESGMTYNNKFYPFSAFEFPSGFPELYLLQHRSCSAPLTYSFASSSGSSTVCLIWPATLASEKNTNFSNTQTIGINIVNKSSSTATLQATSECATSNCSQYCNNNWPLNNATVDAGDSINVAAQPCTDLSPTITTTISGDTIGTIPLILSQSNPHTWQLQCHAPGCPKNLQIKSHPCGGILDSTANATCFQVIVEDSKQNISKEALKKAPYQEALLAEEPKNLKPAKYTFRETREPKTIKLKSQK